LPGSGIKAQRVYSDNGSAYRARAMRTAVAALGLKHRFTRPYTPKTNGKAERFIQTSWREWAYAHAYSPSTQRSARLPAFLHHYNWHRPHHSLNLLAPISRLRLPLNNLLSLHS
jgi:transposase InsO family protein